MTSTQFLDHNRFASKIRNQAVINLMNRVNMKVPSKFKKFSNEIQKSSKLRSENLDSDKAARDYYYQK